MTSKTARPRPIPPRVDPADAPPGADLGKVLFEAAGEGIVVMDFVSNRILEANPRACHLHGYGPGELVGRTVADLLPNPPDPLVVSKIREALDRRGRYESDEHLHRRKDGSLFPCGINLRRVELAGRSYKIAIYRDLSEQHRLSEELRRARATLERKVEERTGELVRAGAELAQQLEVRRTSEEALRASEARLRMLLTQLPAILWTTDAEIRFTSISGAGLAGLGISQGEVLGKTPGQLMGPTEMGERAMQNHRRALGGTPTPYVLLIKDRWFNCHAEPLRDPEGKIMGVIGVCIDDTARLSAERAARESDAQYRKIFEKAPIGVGIGQGGLVRYVNPAWQAMFGYSGRTEMLITRIEDHLEPESRPIFQRFAHRPGHGEPSMPGVDLVGIRKDGSSFDVHLETCRLETPEGECQVLLGTDVTDRRRLERSRKERQADLEREVAQRTNDLAHAVEETKKAYENLKAAQAQLIRSEKLASIGMLVSGVAHEINNPLNVIKGNLDLLKEQGWLDQLLKGGGLSSRDAVRVRGMIEDSGKAARRACAIIETFRSFARDTRSAESVDLNECLEETLEVIQRQVPKGIRLVKRLGRLPDVSCFPGQMKQVFFNLVQNAIEAIPKKGTVRVRSALTKGWVRVEVADTGRGISKEVQRRVFEPFFTTKPLGKGLGLGLSISAMIVHNHSGTITVHSRVGHGTVFRVTLPAR